MFSVPDRGAPVAFASTVNCTAPGPDPDAPSVITSHGAALTAVQAQPGPAVTDTLLAPPDAPMVCDVALRPNVQPLSCVTVTVRPATAIVPLRAGPALGAIDRSTPPLPLPAAAPFTAIHPTALTADHPHDDPVEMSTRAAPPPAPAVRLSGET